MKIEIHSVVSYDTMRDTLPGGVITFDYLRLKGGDKESRQCFTDTDIPVVVMLDRDKQIIGFLSKALAEKVHNGERLGRDVMAQFEQSQNDPTRTFWLLRKPTSSDTEMSEDEIL